MVQRLTADEKRKRLEEKRAQLTAKIKQMDARERQSERKADTRRKIIAGALALEHAAKNEGFGGTLNRLLDEYVTRPDERALFDLPPLAAE